MIITYDYDELIAELKQDVADPTLNIKLEDEMYFLRDHRGMIIDYYFKTDKVPKEAEKLTVKALLQEMMSKNSIIGLIPIEDWAFINKKAICTVQQKAQRGGFKTAEKIANTWFIDAYEEDIDLRVKRNRD